MTASHCHSSNCEQWHYKAGARAVHQNINPAEFSHHLLHQVLGVLKLGNMRGNSQRFSTRRLDFLSHLFQVLQLPAGDHYVSAGIRQGNGDGVTDISGAPDDDGYLSLQ